MSDDTQPAGPRFTATLHGHIAAERTLLDAWSSGRLHHAWLMTGPKGIGKATLAYRFARFLLGGPAAGGDMFGGPPETLFVPENDPLFARVASGGHGDLMIVERQADKDGVLQAVTNVGVARKVSTFFSLTAAESGYRICIVDPADDLNPQAANALLKIIEEPPQRSLILLVSHAPGGLLPTVRSRCRRLAMQRLADTDVAKVLAEQQPDMDDDERRQVIGMADGSPGRALMLTAGGGVELQGKLDTLLGRLPRIDYGQVHALADGMGRRKQTREAFATLADLLDGWLAAAVKRAALANSRQARTLLEARERCRHLLERGARVNLDNKQVLLGVFAAIERATQS